MRLCFILLIFVTSIGLTSCEHNTLPRYQKESSQSLQYSTKPRQELTVKILIHIDNVLVKKLISQYGPKTRRKLKFMTKQILIDVESIFKQLSLNQKIKFNLIDTKFLKNKSKIVPTDENASKYLKSYCVWQSGKKMNQWFYSVLLTGLDLYYLNTKGREVRRSTGRGYMQSMCSVRNSCAVVEWHPRNTAYLLAHEIAHSLGIYHDGRPHNACKERGNMMGAKYDPQTHPRSWSSCSRRALKKYLASKQSWCLKSDHDSSPAVGSVFCSVGEKLQI